MYRIKLYDSDNKLCNTIDTKTDYRSIVDLLRLTSDKSTEIKNSYNGKNILIYNIIRDGNIEYYLSIVKRK